MDRIKEFIKSHDVKEKSKKVGKGVLVSLPIVGLITVGYFGLKTSKDPDYKDWIGDD